MKKLSTLPALLIAGLCTAQTPVQKFSDQHKEAIQMLLDRQAHRMAQKTTGPQQRLIAQRHDRYYPNNNIIADTMHYYYQGADRGSSYNFNGMYYDLASGDNPFFLHRTVQADSSIVTNLNPGGGLPVQRIFTYTPAHNIASFTGYINAPAGPDAAVRNTYTYDAQDRQIVELHQGDNNIPAVWKDNFRMFHTYNAQNNVLMDSVEIFNDTTNAWQPGQTRIYTYDASGTDALSIAYYEAAAGGAFNEMAIIDNSFYPDHRLKTTTYKVRNSPLQAFVPLGTDSFGYTGSNSYYSYRYSAVYDTNGAAHASGLQTSHINAQQLPDTLYFSEWNNGQWQPEQQQVCMYNSYNNPRRLETYYISGGTPMPDNTYIYYYETYNVTSVAAVPTPVQDIQLYPNPAGSLLSICCNDVVAGTPVTINIVNMTGQIVYSQSLRWMGATQQLAIEQLKPGMYMVNINGGDKDYLQSFIKQ